MNSLIRRVGLLHLRNYQPCYMQQRVQPLWIGTHWSPGNRNVYKRKPRTKTLHFRKAQLMAVLKPIRPDPDEGKPMWETCDKVTHPDTGEQPLTKFEEVLMRELQEKLHQSQFVGVVGTMSVSAIDRKRCAVYLGRKKMHLGIYSKRVMNAALTNTVYENLFPLFDGKTFFLFCKEPTVKDMLSIFKKYPQYIVLGGYTEGRILSRPQIEEYAKMPSIDIARAQFVSVLNSASSHLMRTLGTSQSVLVSHLASRAEELKKGGSPASQPNSSSETKASEGPEANA